MARQTNLSTLAGLLFVLALSGGCVKRMLVIESDPPGAVVYLNNQEVGTTPVSVPFKWYGTYDVRLEKEGYQTLNTEQSLEQPWWEHPGPDFFAEAIPNNRVERHWTFALEPATPADDVDIETLLDHASQLREFNLRPAE